MFSNFQACKWGRLELESEKVGTCNLKKLGTREVGMFKYTLSFLNRVIYEILLKVTVWLNG